MFYSTNATSMWAVNGCGSSTCTTNNNKFVRFTGDVSGGACAGTCTYCNSASTGCWCCKSVWPIVDANNNWIGYMTRVSFAIGTGVTDFSDRMMVNINYGTTSTNRLSIAATPNNAYADACFRCGGEGQSGLGA